MTDIHSSGPAIACAHWFRAVMQSMARPGLPAGMGELPPAPAPFAPAAAALALTLCDYQTPVWLAPGLRDPEVASFIRFHTGAPLVEEEGQAHFAFLCAGEEMPPLSAFAQGSHEYPDRSATLVIQAAGFNTAAAELTGPGVKSAMAFGVDGLGRAFWQEMAASHGAFPIGVDVIFVSGEQVSSLPRSSRIRLLEPL